MKEYKAGDTFYEPSGSVHRLVWNPNAKTKARLSGLRHSCDTKKRQSRRRARNRDRGRNHSAALRLLKGGP